MVKEYTLVIIDDHELVREGLVTSLAKEEGFKVVGSFRSAADFLARDFQEAPDLVILDFRLPGEDGVTACESIRERFPGSRVVILTAFSDENALHRCLAAGAEGFLLKDMDIRNIKENLKKVASGENIIDSRMMGSFIDKLKFSYQTRGRIESQFSELELRIIDFVAKGLTNREIAVMTAHSPNTIKFHISKIMKKLDVKKRPAIVSKARSMGIKSPPLQRNSAL